MNTTIATKVDVQFCISFDKQRIGYSTSSSYFGSIERTKEQYKLVSKPHGGTDSEAHRSMIKFVTQ